MIRAALITGALSLAAPAAAGDFELTFPIDCTLGDDCFVQQYVDADPGPSAIDFTCGPLTYDGHKGTDFAILTMAMMRSGVNVFASAPGTVRGIRNAMRDELYTPETAARIKGRECGNGVVIEHGNGWETQYCHMKQGSISVQPGQKVDRGTILGEVGLSGETEFPHVQLSVRKNGKPVDPFNRDGVLACDGPQKPTLWQNELPYVGGGIVSLGFSTRIPEFSEVKDGTASADTLPSDVPALVLWGQIYGGRAGDDVVLKINGPDGIFTEQVVALEKTQARLFRAIGRRINGQGLAAGTYQGIVQLRRDGSLLSERQVAIPVGK